MNEFDLRGIRRMAVNALSSRDSYSDINGTKMVSSLAEKIIELLEYIEVNNIHDSKTTNTQ